MQRVIKLNFLDRWCSDEHVEENSNAAACPFKLVMELQEKGKEVHNEIVHQHLSKIDALKKLKPHNYTGRTKNTMITNAIF